MRDKTEPAVKSEDEKTKPTPPVPIFTSDTRPVTPPPFMVVGDDFVAQTEAGEFTTSLRISERVAIAMGNLTMRDQFNLMLEARDQGEWAEMILDLDETDAVILRSKFFQAHSERQQARLGESFGSSDS
jgi:hypothetical protein